MNKCLKIGCLVFLLLFALHQSGYSQRRDLKFEHINISDGLPATGITVIKQDSLGFIWFGTENGLVRYDGYQMKIFQPQENNPHSISGLNITDIVEDYYGDMWIATKKNGINKYERKSGKFFRFKHDSGDSMRLSSNNVWSLFLDRYDYLWVVYVDSGLDKININNGTVTRYLQNNRVSLCLYNFPRNYHGARLWKKHTAICEDHNGDIWIGTYGKGAFRYNRDIETFTHYEHEADNASSLSDNRIMHIIKAKNGTIWFSTWGGGLDSYSEETNAFSHYQHKEDDTNSMTSDNCMSIFEDKSENLWISHQQNSLDCFDVKNNRVTHLNPYRNTLRSWNEWYSVLWQDESNVIWFINSASTGDQLLLYNPVSGHFSQYKENIDDPSGLKASYIRSFCRDHSGILWFGGPFRGVNKLNPLAQNFLTLKHDPANTNSLHNNRVCAVLQSPKNPNIIWIGTSTGLDKYDQASGSFTHYQYNPANPHGPPDNVISLWEDERSRLWIGSSGRGGLSCYDESTNRFTNYTAIKREAKELYPWNVNKLFLESPDSLWIGTSDNGLYCYNIKKKFFTCYETDPANVQSLSYGSVISIDKDRQGTLWIGTSQGLNKFNPGDQTFTRYLAGKTINTIFEDRNNNCWIGSDHRSGLGLFDRSTGVVVFFDKEDGLPCNRIDGIFEDEQGYLWLATEGAGLSRFNPITKKFTNFSEHHGLPTQLLHLGGTQLNDGRICLKTVYNGLIIFHPDEIKINTIPPRIVFTDIKLFNKSLTVHPDSVLKEDISVAREIHFAHWQNDISFECTALHYSHPQKNQYVFWMENYDQEWIYSGTNRVATYTNLDPGTYIFHAKAANSDGVWNEEGAFLRIVIDPPWWTTWWAYGLYLFLFCATIIITWRLQLRRIHLKNDLKMRDFEAKKLKEVDHLKSRFFANISHEFRTPITLILGPIEKLLSRAKDSENLHDLNIMRRNANRLHRLINQLLDLSKLEAGRMQLKARRQDIVPLINRFIQSFESQAKLKRIDLVFSSYEEMIFTYVDIDKLENIIYNLVSNALKFTSVGGKVTVSIREKEPTEHHKQGLVEIVVEDTGTGLSPDQLDQVFDRFYQGDESTTREHEGSGIGLALTKELVELHQGEITVVSELGKGSTFTVWLPLGRDHLTDDHILDDISSGERHPVRESTAETETGGDRYSVREPSTVTAQKVNKNDPILLIVEDNDDLRTYIRDLLKSDYHIKEASDGEKGLTQSFSCSPDLIISDVMMPGMDGIELCTRLKTDERTSHIPVILLTARAGLESKLEGLETGADDYIVKPFAEKELRVRIKNLIENRRKLRERFSRELLLKPGEITLTSADENFLQRAMDIVNQNMENPDFRVSDFIQKIGMSRMQLHRKLNALTDQSCSRFIRILRLKRAALLLKQHQDTISEIAYKVGFNKPSYFAECFRKHFGISPSEYIHNQS